MVGSAVAAVEQSEAQVKAAEADVTRAGADLGRMTAKLYQSDRERVRSRKLETASSIADTDYDPIEALRYDVGGNRFIGRASRTIPR